MALSDETMIVGTRNEEQTVASMILNDVYQALEEKGYNPVNQIVGYLLSGDPTYITSYHNARSNIRRIERDELIEELVRTYVKQHGL